MEEEGPRGQVDGRDAKHRGRASKEELPLILLLVQELTRLTAYWILDSYFHYHNSITTHDGLEARRELGGGRSSSAPRTRPGPIVVLLWRFFEKLEADLNVRRQLT